MSIEEDFRKQYDELGLKPPKNSMPNLEREIIIDYWRKHINELQTELLKAVENKKRETGELDYEDGLAEGYNQASEDIKAIITSVFNKK